MVFGKDMKPFLATINPFFKIHTKILVSALFFLTFFLYGGEQNSKNQNNKKNEIALSFRLCLLFVRASAFFLPKLTAHRIKQKGDLLVEAALRRTSSS